MSSEKKIYVVRVKSGCEKTSAEALRVMIEDQGLESRFGEIIVPTEDVAEFKGSEKKIVNKVLIKGYIFIEMEQDDELFHKVTEFNPKITGFLKVGKDQAPQFVSKAEIKAMLGDSVEKAARSSSEQYQAGQKVKVISGPFKDFSGVVEEANNEKQKAKVSVLIFGRATPVELDFYQIEPD